MPHIDIRTRLLPEELPLFEEVQRKFPTIDFSIQRCTQYRASSVMRYMQLTHWDADVQRFLSLSGVRWKDVHLVVAAISRSRSDYMRQELEKLGVWVPENHTDELKSLANRVDSEGDSDALYEEAIGLRSKLLQVESQRDMYENQNAKLEKRLAKAEEELERANDFIRTFSQQTTELNQQWRDAFSARAAAVAAAPAAEPKAATAPAERLLTDEEIQEAEMRREARQADRIAKEEEKRKDDAWLAMRPYMHDRDKCFQMLDVMGNYSDFRDVFNYVLKTFADAGELNLNLIQENRGGMVVAEQLSRFMNLGKPVAISTIANYLNRAIQCYQNSEKY